MSQAKALVVYHQELQAQAAALGAQVHALQAEHSQKVTKHKKALDKRKSAMIKKNGIVEGEQLLSPGVLIEKQQHQKRHQRQLIANVERLHAEVQQLQDVNKSYTHSTTSNSAKLTTERGVVRMQNTRPMTDCGRGGNTLVGTITKPEMSAAGLNCFVLKEKMDMKENYDTFSEVLATLKQEISNVGEAFNSSHIKTETDVLAQNIDKQAQQSSASFAISTQSPSSSSGQILTSKQNPIARVKSVQPKPSRDQQIVVSVSQQALNSAVAMPTLAVTSSSWTTHSKISATDAKSSPRILPPGMKIDIKKPLKVGANGLKPSQASIPQGAKTSHMLNPSQLNGVLYQNTKASQLIGSKPVSSSYTDNEKAAAHDLISLKEGFVASSQIGQQTTNSPHLQLSQSQLQQHVTLTKDSQHMQYINNTGFVVNSFINVAEHKKTPEETFVLSKSLPASRDSTSISFLNHTTTSKRGRPSSSKTGLGSAAHPILIPDLNTSPQPNGAINSRIAPSESTSLSQDIIHAVHVSAISSNTKNASSVQRPFTGTVPSIIAKSNTFRNKHKLKDHTTGCNTILGPSAQKKRTVESKREPKKQLASVKPSSLINPLTLQPTGAMKPNSTVRHLLSTPTLSNTTLGSAQCSITNTISSTNFIPYVAIHTPQTGSATTTTPTTTVTTPNSGSQAALLKLLQKQHATAPKVAVNGWPETVNFRSDKASDKGALAPARNKPIIGQGQVDSQGQAVKLIPKAGMDGSQDWWILVMQNDQTGNQVVVPQAQVEASTVINVQPH